MAHHVMPNIAILFTLIVDSIPKNNFAQRIWMGMVK